MSGDFGVCPFYGQSQTSNALDYILEAKRKTQEASENKSQHFHAFGLHAIKVLQNENVK
jgi:hypothetical protein